MKPIDSSPSLIREREGEEREDDYRMSEENETKTGRRMRHTRGDSQGKEENEEPIWNIIERLPGD